jgi:hypothetical protein
MPDFPHERAEVGHCGFMDIEHDFRTMTAETEFCDVCNRDAPREQWRYRGMEYSRCILCGSE